LLHTARQANVQHVNKAKKYIFWCEIFPLMKIFLYIFFILQYKRFIRQIYQLVLHGIIESTGGVKCQRKIFYMFRINLYEWNSCLHPPLVPNDFHSTALIFSVMALKYKMRNIMIYLKELLRWKMRKRRFSDYFFSKKKVFMTLQCTDILNEWIVEKIILL
jgi:hypothetical protein